MWDWIGANSDKIGAAVIGLAGVAAATWQWLLKARLQKASTGAEVAVAQSSERVYEQMTARLTTLDAEMGRLRTEVDALRDQVRDRDNKIHAMELHIKDLEHTLRQHGIEPPAKYW